MRSLIPEGVDPSAVALTSATGQRATFGNLRELAQRLPLRGAGLVLLKTENSVDLVSSYIACFLAGVPIALIDRSVTDEVVASLVATYRPTAVVGHGVPLDGYTSPGEFEGTTWQHRDGDAAPTHPELGVMLATSGSTGSPKFVKLSRTAVISNAESIAQGLRIRDAHRAVTSLPFSYSYGLSVINSHLVSGASTAVTNEAVVTKPFWDLVRTEEVSTIAGVPTTYKMLRQMRWDASDLPHLVYATQAGGRLPDPDRQHFLDTLGAAGKDFVVMYGQTEATARITIAPTDLLREHLSTAGKAIPGGTLIIDESSGANETDGPTAGAVSYRGPNVMMGYASSAEDLLTGDELGGVLETGDLGYLVDGALFLTGRSKRIVKAFGVRVSLDDVDSWLQQRGTAVAVQGDDSIEVFVESHELEPQELRRELAAHLGLHPTGVRVSAIDKLPLLSSGKIDFVTLQQEVGK